MLINLSDVFKEQGKVMKVTTPVEMNAFRLGQKYEIIEKNDFEWTLTNIEPGRAKVEGKDFLQSPLRQMS